MIIVMTENTNLLIKDISARIPYGAKCQCDDDNLIATIIGIKFHENQCFVELDYKDFKGIVEIEKCKPLLIPLSEMSEMLSIDLDDTLIDLELKSINDEIDHSKVAGYEIDFYLKHHIDFRNLINHNLAKNANNLNVY